MYHPESHIVYAANGADVRHVMIAGRQVVKDRKLMTVDVEQVIRRVNAISQEIRSRFKMS
jgi:5-methylthioadenosine/S-adenosylhomocysteine deaminase